MKLTQVHLDERELWDRLKSGDTNAFGQISTHYYRILFDYGRKFTKDRELIKDVIQDALLVLWQKRAHINPDENAKLYLLKIIRNSLFKELQKQHLRVADGQFDELEFMEPEESFIISAESSQQMNAKLQLHLKNLPKRQQEVLFLKFYQDLSNDQIAEVMNIHRQSVANLLHNGLRLLKNHFFLTTLYFILTRC
ncbi:RNA polymerase sigma factor [Runella limosa]|uniref:RNA polymerase sigma factor n=1 Tax=Runella limosa TaxID=370978 RepID=UPI00040E7269|nr:sigma-70 family RNA polymerase sigma factor [Runella limosa]